MAKNREVLSNRVIGSGAFTGNLVGEPKQVGDGLIGRLMVGSMGCDVGISEKMVESLREQGFTKVRLTALGDLYEERVSVDNKQYSNYGIRGSIRYADSDYFYAVANGGLISDISVGDKDGREYATGAIVATVGKKDNEDVKVLVSAIGSFHKAAEFGTKGRRVRFSGPATVDVGEKGPRVSIRGASLGLGEKPKDDDSQGQQQAPQGQRQQRTSTARAPAPAPATATAYNFGDDSDDNIPF